MAGRCSLLPGCCLLLALALITPVRALPRDQCDRPLGMESGEIVDSQITASSSHNVNSVGPQSGRIRTEHRGGAWCPLPVITDSVHEYLQVDLGQLMVVTAAETQGRFGNGHGVEWAEHFSLQYWRDEAGGWRMYRNGTGHTILDGNNNAYLAQKTLLVPPLVGSKVRIVPRSSHPRTVCLRAELHGCPYSDAIDSYSMESPDPSRPDLTYDGVAGATGMSNGLGQLTDGIQGPDDITKSEWVGWRREVGETVSITFIFDDVRELESVSFHVSNRFTAGVRLFSRAALYFSVDGSEYTESPLTLEPSADRIFEDARKLELRLYRQIGRYVRIELTAADQWILLSEITFQSAPATYNVTGLQRVTPPLSTNPSPPAADAADDGGESTASLAALLGALGLVLLLLSALVGYVVRASRRRRVAGGSAPSPLHLPLARHRKQGLGLGGQTSPGHGYSRSAADLYGPLPGEEDKVDLSQPQYRVVRLNSEYDTLAQQRAAHRHDVSYDYAVPVDPLIPGPLPCNQETPGLLSITNPSPRSWDNPNYRQSPHDTSGSSSGSSSGGQPSVCSISELLPAPPPLPPPPTQSNMTASASTRRRRVTAHSVQGVTGTCVWTCDKPDGNKPVRVPEIDADMIQLRDTIGDGQYGDVRVCEVHLRSARDSPYQAPSRLATARCLRSPTPADVSRKLRLEADVLCRVTDPHVTRLLGYCTIDDAPGIVVEYLENGDLNEFLRRWPAESARGQDALVLADLIHIAEQIATGMQHLETLGIVHGDLAARNCLVGRQLQVKVGDLGPGRHQYASDYVTLADGRVLPLRWRAPETVFTAELSSGCDVWAFAVTLWEILTWCRLQPLAHLCDSAVTDRLASYREPLQEPHLQQPNACPPPLYQLMMSCWRLQARARPAFAAVRSALRRSRLAESREPETEVV